MNKIIILLFLVCFAFSCTRKYESELNVYSSESMKTAISGNFKSSHFNRISFIPGNSPSVFSIKISDSRDNNHYIALDSVNLSNMLPKIPVHILGNKYLESLFLNTQVENEYFINFTKELRGLRFKGNEYETQNLSIIQLKKTNDAFKKWALTLYVNDSGEELPYFKADFDFPDPVFESVFLENNKTSSTSYEVLKPDFNGLENSKIDTQNLINVDSLTRIRFENLNSTKYPKDLSAARGYVKSPTNFAFISELMTDSTFIEIDNSKKQKKCQYGRFQTLHNVKIGSTEEEKTLEFLFSDLDSLRTTKLIIGKFEPSEFDFKESDAEIWPFGVGLRPLIHSYDSMKKPFKFGVFVDGSNNYLPTESIGVGAFQIFKSEYGYKRYQLYILGPNKKTIVGNYSFILP